VKHYQGCEQRKCPLCSFVRKDDLHQAARDGDVDACRTLMQCGADPNEHHKQAPHMTPLHYAAVHGHAAVCSALLANSADPNSVIIVRHVDLRRLSMAELGKFLCAFGYSKSQIGSLLRWDRVHAIRSAQGCSPLQFAARKGHIEVCRVLIDGGADCNAGAGKQKTPLHCAASEGNAILCAVLAELGADVNAVDDQEETPLHTAAIRGHAAACLELVHAGSSVTKRASKRNPPGATPNKRVGTAACFALRGKHHALATHLQAHLGSGLRSGLQPGVYVLRCTGPDRRRKLMWGDTSKAEEEAVLDGMQAQWLARVEGASASARVGQLLRQVLCGGKRQSRQHAPAHVMCTILSFIGLSFEASAEGGGEGGASGEGEAEASGEEASGEGTCAARHLPSHSAGATASPSREYLMSCLSIARVCKGRDCGLHVVPQDCTTGHVREPHAKIARKCGGAGGGAGAAAGGGVTTAGAAAARAEQQQGQQVERGHYAVDDNHPRLALVMLVLAHELSSARWGVQRAMAERLLVASTVSAGDGGCVWLYDYCAFVLRRLGASNPASEAAADTSGSGKWAGS
jgi:hypothetical protein